MNQQAILSQARGFELHPAKLSSLASDTQLKGLGVRTYRPDY